jgi:hypothetical protein
MYCVAWMDHVDGAGVEERHFPMQKSLRTMDRQRTQHFSTLSFKPGAGWERQRGGRCLELEINRQRSMALGAIKRCAKSHGQARTRCILGNSRRRHFFDFLPLPESSAFGEVTLKSLPANREGW